MARVTLATLARDLGVSHQTVSNVINAPHKVRPETRARVQAAIDASGYRPSAAGRALRSSRSGLVGLRLAPPPDGINGVVMDRFLHACVREVERVGRRTAVFTPASAANEVTSFVDAFRRTEIDGVVLTDSRPGDPRPAALAAAGMPFVCFGRPWGDDAATHSWVDVDGAAGVGAATRHLRSLGHTRIGYLGWTRAGGTGRDREEGYRRAMGDALDETLVARARNAVAPGATAAAELRRRGATAVVCASDSLALGALDAFTDRQAVTGFDDTPVAAALGMASLAQPVERAATLLVGALIGLIDDNPAPVQTLLQPVLRTRADRLLA